MLLAAAQPMAAKPSQDTAPDSPSSGYLEFPQRQPAATSSEEAANAALLAQTPTQRSAGIGATSSAGSIGEVRLQAVLVSSSDDSDEQQLGIKDKFRKAALGLGQSPPRQSLGASPRNASRPSNNKKRFSLEALKIPFLSTRKVSSNSVSAASISEDVSARNGPGNDDDKKETLVVIGPRDQADLAIEQTVLPPISYVELDDSEAPIFVAPKPPPKALAVPEERGRAAMPRSALSRPSSPHRAAVRSASSHRVSFSPSTDEAVEAREQALATLAKEEAKKLEQERKAEIKRRKREEKLSRKTSSANGGAGGGGDGGLARLRGLKSFSTGNLLDISRFTSHKSVVSSDDDITHAGYADANMKRDKAAVAGYGLTQQPGNARFSLDKRGIRLHGVRGRGKGKAAKVKVTKKQAVAARHAKLLEQVINAGMGLHPPEPRPGITVAAGSDKSKGKKASSSKAATTVGVSASQLKELKKALMDVETANHIIDELRCMHIPQRTDSLSHLATGGKGHGGVDGATHIGSHGRERVLSMGDVRDPSLARATFRGTGDGELVDRGPSRSAAEDALRRLELKSAKVETAPQQQQQQRSLDSNVAPTMVQLQERTSSLAADALAAAAPTAATGHAAALLAQRPAQAGGKAAVAHATRPRKAVCLDCGEFEAHQRHAKLHQQKKRETEQVDLGAVAGAATLGMAAIAAGTYAATHQPGVESSTQQKEDGDAVAVITATSAATPSPAGRPHDMIRSKSSPLFPMLEEGRALFGSTPVQLLISPTSTIIGSSAQVLGAFDALANISGAVVRATTDDMDAVRPPLDRMAIFVHWWGFELTLPKPTMDYLDTAHSVSGAFLSFLQTMALSGGIPELQPFIKYVSIYMDVEFKAIKEQDKGHGVCVAATWLMPLALIPRPFDYNYDEAPSSAAAPAAAAPAYRQGPLPLPPLSSLSSSAAPAAPSTPTRPRHAIHQKTNRIDSGSISPKSLPQARSSTTTTAATGISIPKRNISPSQMAAIQSARTERIPTDLSAERPASWHSRSSSVDSKEAGTAPAATMAALVAARRDSVGASLSVALESVEEVPEGSLRFKVK